MPTNILRKQSKRPSVGSAPPPARAKGVRRIVIRAGRVSIKAELLDTPTADRIWAALPLHSTAETFGAAIHSELPIESGRERTAKLLGVLGELYYWSEEDRILIPFGPTPISRPGEVRLPSPCNLWAMTKDDVTLLKKVRPGEKVSMTVA